MCLWTTAPWWRCTSCPHCVCEEAGPERLRAVPKVPQLPGGPQTPAVWPQNPCSSPHSRTSSGVSASTSGRATRTLQEGERARASRAWVGDEEDCGAGQRLEHFKIKRCSRQSSSPPSEVHILMPGSCEYVTFHSERDLQMWGRI